MWLFWKILSDPFLFRGALILGSMVFSSLSAFFALIKLKVKQEITWSIDRPPKKHSVVGDDKYDKYVKIKVKGLKSPIKMKVTINGTKKPLAKMTAVEAAAYREA